MDFITQLDRMNSGNVTMTRSQYLQMLSVQYINRPKGQVLIKDNEVIYRPGKCKIFKD